MARTRVLVALVIVVVLSSFFHPELGSPETKRTRTASGIPAATGAPPHVAVAASPLTPDSQPASVTRGWEDRHPPKPGPYTYAVTGWLDEGSGTWPLDQYLTLTYRPVHADESIMDVRASDGSTIRLMWSHNGVYRLRDGVDGSYSCGYRPPLHEVRFSPPSPWPVQEWKSGDCVGSRKGRVLRRMSLKHTNGKTYLTWLLRAEITQRIHGGGLTQLVETVWYSTQLGVPLKIHRHGTTTDPSRSFETEQDWVLTTSP